MATSLTHFKELVLDNDLRSNPVPSRSRLVVVDPESQRPVLKRGREVDDGSSVVADTQPVIVELTCLRLHDAEGCIGLSEFVRFEVIVFRRRRISMSGEVKAHGAYFANNDARVLLWRLIRDVRSCCRLHGRMNSPRFLRDAVLIQCWVMSGLIHHIESRRI